MNCTRMVPTESARGMIVLLAAAAYALAPLAVPGYPSENEPQAHTRSLIEAAGRGDAQAQYELASSYEVGIRVGKDYTEALKWYRQAADQNEVHAQVALGRMLEYGLGIKQSYVEAAAW